MGILTCKCPSCDKVTSQCKDSTLEKDRTEYDGKRCKHCVHGPAKRKHLFGGRWFPSKKQQAKINFGGTRY